ncbi:phosphatidylglycerophosphatase and protein-tyrosine phosphatase 1-like isoform X2 [Xenia sp. Carnegie-2017]|uniref:phosphatidylglycerophosphatase and protein-tyrosine phosphatase 1-like isoform X2 n=1 Tax=Xenia sp. Carnegie-2017 TaxID=2897299 RepID=UPI001F03D778|nr:phosphatidylglycerophosphatase and protein-tyrosine phosphatase 1-like isoform X2 [Xenia sp. Carnegie-2017]
MTQNLKDLKDKILHKIQSNLTSSKAARVLFYPTLLLNVITVGFSKKKRWYNRIDENVVLGALPFRVITPAEWLKLGVIHLQLPTVDFNNAPKYNELKQGVKFIKQFDGKKKSCYVHCKAGRGRSATLTACYLIEMYHYSPSEAVAILKSKRQQTLLGSNQLSSIDDYYERFQERNNKN